MLRLRAHGEALKRLSFEGLIMESSAFVVVSYASASGPFAELCRTPVVTRTLTLALARTRTRTLTRTLTLTQTLALTLTLPLSRSRRARAYSRASSGPRRCLWWPRRSGGTWPTPTSSTPRAGRCAVSQP